MQFRKLFTALFAAFSTLDYFVVVEAQVNSANNAGAWTGPELGTGTGYFPDGRTAYGSGMTNINEGETSEQGLQQFNANNNRQDGSRYVPSPLISRESPNLNAPSGLNFFNLESLIGADLKSKFGKPENGGSFKSNEGTSANSGAFAINNQNFGINRGIANRENTEILPLNTAFPAEVQNTFPARNTEINSFIPQYGTMRDTGGTAANSGIFPVKNQNFGLNRGIANGENIGILPLNTQFPSEVKVQNSFPARSTEINSFIPQYGAMRDAGGTAANSGIFPVNNPNFGINRGIANRENMEILPLNTQFPAEVNVQNNFPARNTEGNSFIPQYGAMRDTGGTAAYSGIFPVNNHNFGINRGIANRDNMEVLPLNTQFPSEVKVQNSFPARNSERKSFIPQYGAMRDAGGTAANSRIFPVNNQNFEINRGIVNRENMEILPLNTQFPSEVKVQNSFPARNRESNIFIPEYGDIRGAGGVHHGRANNFFPSVAQGMATRPGVAQSLDIMNTGLNKNTRPEFEGLDFSLSPQDFGNPGLNIRSGNREGAEHTANYNSGQMMVSKYPLLPSVTNNDDRPDLGLLNNDNMDSKQGFDRDNGDEKTEIANAAPNDDTSLSDGSGPGEQLSESDTTRSDGVINESDAIDTTTDSSQVLTTVAPNVTTPKPDISKIIAATADKFNSPSTLHFISSAVSSLISDKEIDLASLPSVILSLAMQIRSAFPGLPPCEQVNQVFLEIIVALGHVLKYSTVGDVDMDSIPETADLIIQAFGTANA